MKHKVANHLADKIVFYLSVRGTWDIGKSEKRRREIKEKLLSSQSSGSFYQRSCLQYRNRKLAADKLISNIFNITG